MSVTRGHWHGVAVEREVEGDPESELLYDVMHPSGCAWSIDFIPRSVDHYGNTLGEAMYVRRYCCDVDYEMAEHGTDSLPTEPGFYWLRMEHYVSPSGPWGGSEYDTDVSWTIGRRPTVQVQPGEEQ